MGMYPSADLSYGIDIGRMEWDEPEDGQDHEELEWLTWELWSESWEWETASSTYLASEGIEDVRMTNYGHPDQPQWALASRVTGVYGWGEVQVVTGETLEVTDDDDRLKRAWALLFPGRKPGQIAWRLSATFG
jgi:hypothetical protein